MSQQWFRLYAEFATDPKVQMMSEVMQRRLIMLFCLRCSDVTVTASDEEIAFQMRISVEELAETKALFVRKGFIDSAWNVVKWDKRQFASDSSAARTRAYRDRRRNNDVTSHVTECDVLEQNRTEQIQNRVTRKRAPKTSLADDFAVSERVKAWAIEKGYSRLSEHLDAFKAKAKANGYTYVDWDSAFMEAIRNDWARLRVTTQSSHGGDSVAATRKL